MDLRLSEPLAEINHEIERKYYVGAVVDVSVITTKICNKVLNLYLRTINTDIIYITTNIILPIALCSGTHNNP